MNKALSAIHVPYRRARYEFRNLLSQWPGLYLPLTQLKRPVIDGPASVCSNTELVIEAFPRSGNTFASYAFRMSQQEPVKLAHHFHAPAQLIAAARRGIPALLIVRDPVDAVSSFILREQVISARQALRAWILFHRVLRPFADDLVTATFTDVISDFGEVVSRVNRRFGTKFCRFEHTEQNVAMCMKAMEESTVMPGSAVDERQISRPSSVRERLKPNIVELLERETDLLTAARHHYRWYASRTHR